MTTLITLQNVYFLQLCIIFTNEVFVYLYITLLKLSNKMRGCAGGRIGTRFLRPRGTSPLKGANPGV